MVRGAKWSFELFVNQELRTWSPHEMKTPARAGALLASLRKQTRLRRPLVAANRMLMVQDVAHDVIVWKTIMIVKQVRGTYMTGETNLQKLLRELDPRLNEGEYVYCTLESKDRAAQLDPLFMFAEEESVTLILPKGQADTLGFPYASTFAWITLTVHSSLEAVGLTSAVAHALAEAKISCNVVAAYYHDHIFVPVQDAALAMTVLHTLTGETHE
jgi:hypothetical protein